MTKKNIEQILESKYLSPTRDDWYNMMVGTVVGMGIYGAIGSLILMKLEMHKFILLSYLISLLSIISYFYWKDGQVKIIRTRLTKRENLDLLKEVFKQLNWGICDYANEVKIEDSKYILKLIDATFVYSDNFIGYNFQYASSIQGGRPAFFIGIRTYLKNRFERKLKAASDILVRRNFL